MMKKYIKKILFVAILLVCVFVVSGRGYNVLADKASNTDADSKTTEATTEPQADYIVNMNSKKIHLPTCSSVDDMAEHNKQEFAGDINELIGQGYSPCKRCNPM